MTKFHNDPQRPDRRSVILAGAALAGAYLPPALASAQKARIISGDREAVHFAWYGPSISEKTFGYRVIGDGFVIELGSVDRLPGICTRSITILPAFWAGRPDTRHRCEPLFAFRGVCDAEILPRCRSNEIVTFKYATRWRVLCGRLGSGQMRRVEIGRSGRMGSRKVGSPRLIVGYH